MRREVEELLGDERLYADGLKVYTCVDVGLQDAARRALRQGLIDLAARQGYKGPLRQIEPPAWNAFLEQAASESLVPGRRIQALVTAVDAKAGTVTLAAGNISTALTSDDFGWAVGKKRVDKVFAPGQVVMARVVDSPPTGPALSLEPTRDVQGALVCLDNDDGAVRAMIGGRDFGESQFNRAAQALRQPGSSFKPFVYTAAMDAGFTPADIIWDEPVEYEDMGKIWAPQNYDRKFEGPTTLYWGLVRSRNVVAVRLLEQVGPKLAVRYARMMGITTPLAPYLSLALGSFEVIPLEMASAYTTFPNLGERVAPYFIERIEDRDGRVIYKARPERYSVLSPQTSYVILDMLKGVVERGTGARVRALGRPAAGKTGTTNDLADAWFIGFTPDYTAAVWIGKDERERLGRGETGGRTAAPVFLAFMKEAHQDLPVRDFTMPRGVVYASIDAETGGPATEYSEKTLTVCFKEGLVGQGPRSELTPLLEDRGEDGPTEHVRLIFRDGKVYTIREPLNPDGSLVIQDQDAAGAFRVDPSAPALNPGASTIREEDLN